MQRAGSSILVGLTAVTLLASPQRADAFCGFYVGGASADLFNNATQVVLMREGTRTVLSMQNNYQGPPDSFAMVVPVPVVLQEENVKTLDRGIFARVDSLAAPRLVEYWEEDPCQPQVEYDMEGAGGPPTDVASNGKARERGVTIEARFTVGEYQIVILSAKDSTGLDTWLREQKYRIPEGAAPYLQPYVESGSKFFVAKVDTEKVTFKDGMAMLSPLRFHYDSNEFSLPVRLGLINSQGTQDLIVHVLARGQRYELANYKNATIPTNLEVSDETRERFGEFYAALFDRTLEKNPGAVITEYSWDASSCDPCPTPPLTSQDLLTLGEDVLYLPAKGGKAGKGRESGPQGRESRPMGRGGFVLTRLHARYGKGAMAEDLVFRAARPIMGGREMGGPGGKLESGAREGGINNFQGRYIIRHEWQGKVACESPSYGIWGGPPSGTQGSSAPTAAKDLAFAPRGKIQLASFVPAGVPEIGVSAGAARASDRPADSGKQAGPDKTESKTEKPPRKESKGCAAYGSDPGPGGLALALFCIVAITRRSTRERRIR